MSRHTRPHDHSLAVSPELLADEVARRLVLAHLRHELTHSGRIAFRWEVTTPWAFVHNVPRVCVVMVLGCTADHGGPR